jgi:hypothetical protein
MNPVLQNPRTRPPVGPPTSGVIPSALQPTFSQRHAHILRLHDLLVHLVSLPPSYPNSVRSLRAWRCLAKAKEVDFHALWRLGAKVLERTTEVDVLDDRQEREFRNGRKATWIKECQGKSDQLEKFTEYILSLAAAGKHRHALDELES